MSAVPRQRSGAGQLHRWAAILPIAVLVGIISGTFHAFSVFFVPVTAEFGWNSAATSSIFSLSQLLNLLSSVPGGRLSDIWDPSSIMMGGAAIFAIGIAAMSVAQSLAHALVFYGFFVGIGLGTTWTPAMAAVNRLFAHSRGWAMGVITTMNSAWVATVGLAVRTLVNTMGWRTGYVIYGLILGAITLCAAWLTRRTLQAQAPLLAPTPEAGQMTAGLTLGQSLRSPQLWLLLLGALCSGLAGSILLIHLVPFAVSDGLPETVAAVALTAFGLARVPASIGLGWLSDRVNRATLLGCVMAIASAAIFALYLLGPSRFLMPTAIIFGLGWSASVMLFAPLTGDMFGEEHIGGIYGIINAGFTGGTVAGPILAGYVHDTTGRYGPVVVMAALTFLMAAGALFTIRAIRHRERQAR